MLADSQFTAATIFSYKNSSRRSRKRKRAVIGIPLADIFSIHHVETASAQTFND
jgi:hypothetical protein